MQPFHPGKGTTRRDIIRSGAMGLFGLGLNRLGLLNAAVAPASKGKAKAVILIFNGGAPSHLDLWDPKPDAPSEIRGTFSPIPTNVPGIHISELLPRMAKRMDKLALIRSVFHTHSSHNSGMYWSTAGRPYPIDSTLINPSRADLPCFGTLVGWLAQRDGFTGGVPPYVITPFPHCDSKAYITPGQYGGCLGAQYDPFVLDDDPNAAGFRVRNLGLNPDMSPARFEERLALLQDLSASSQRIRSRRRRPMSSINRRYRSCSPARQPRHSISRRNPMPSGSVTGGTHGVSLICSRAASLRLARVS
jgi:hypothetical protein